MAIKFDPTVLIGPCFLDEQKTEQINLLLKQLSELAPKRTWEEIGNILSQPNFSIVLLGEPETDEIIGMASLILEITLMRTVGRVEDVVVDKKYRGRQLGEMLMKYLISIAKIKRCSYISLTSNPKRVAANVMYLKMGFQLIGKVGESNYYRLDL